MYLRESLDSPSDYQLFQAIKVVSKVIIVSKGLKCLTFAIILFYFQVV